METFIIEFLPNSFSMINPAEETLFISKNCCVTWTSYTCRSSDIPAFITVQLQVDSSADI